VQQQTKGRFKEESFPAILKRERVLRGWSQADVATRIGSDPKTVGRWERGLTFPSPFLCQRLSEVYEKTAQELGLVVSEKQLVSETIESKERYGSDEIGKAADRIQLEASREGTEVAPLSVSHTLRNKHQFFAMRSGVMKRPRLFGSLFMVILVLVAANAWYFLHGGFVSQVSRAASPPSNPYTTGQEKLVLHESLQENTASSWSLGNDEEGQCFFADGAYRIRAIRPGGYVKLCLAAETYFNDFTYEAQMQVIAGDCGGLGFRSTFPQLYYFIVCQDGNYRFVRYNRDDISKRRIIVSGVSVLLHRGLNQTNALAVVAKGDTFTLYINHKQLYHGTDGAYLDGQIGLLAHPCSIVYLTPQPDVCSVPVEVVFRDVKVWTS
jgi:transcriptional regulator with XRE-family HTH domain